MQDPWQGRQATLPLIPASGHVTLHMELSAPHKPCGTAPASCCALSQSIFPPSGSWRFAAGPVLPLCTRVYSSILDIPPELQLSLPPLSTPWSTGLDFTGATVSVPSWFASQTCFPSGAGILAQIPLLCPVLGPVCCLTLGASIPCVHTPAATGLPFCRMPRSPLRRDTSPRSILGLYPVGISQQLPPCLP